MTFVKSEVDVNKKPPKDQIYQPLETLPVNDNNINGIGIEEVI